MAEKNSMRKYNSTKQSQTPSPLGEGRGGVFLLPPYYLLPLSPIKQKKCHGNPDEVCR